MHIVAVVEHSDIFPESDLSAYQEMLAFTSHLNHQGEDYVSYSSTDLSADEHSKWWSDVDR